MKEKLNFQKEKREDRRERRRGKSLRSFKSEYPNYVTRYITQVDRKLPK